MLVLNKILAIYVGPSGYAMMGQLQNAVTTLTALASAGVGTGVTKYTAEYAQDVQRLRIVWGTAGTTGFVAAAILGTVLALFHRPIAGAVLKDEAYGDIFLWVAACLLLFVLNSLLLAILNGKKEIRLFVLANIANSLIALLVTGALARLYGLYGALVALAVNQSLSCFLTLWLCRKTAWFKLQDLFCWPDKEALGRLSHYTLMALATSIIGPIAQMLVRDILLGRFGSDAAGYWEALTRISNLYLMFITTPLSVYYLPKLAELHEKRDLRREIAQGYRLLMPVAVACALTVFVLRDWIVHILFSADFLPMRDLFPWQMVGDVLRIAAWLLSFFLLSKRMTGIFLATEIFFSSTFVLFSWFLSEVFGTQGVPMAYAMNHAIYVVLVGYFVYKKLSEKCPNLFAAEK
jgi:PST family polysaccharide transporter